MKPHTEGIISVMAHQTIVPSSAAPMPNSNARPKAPRPSFDPASPVAQERQMTARAISKYSSVIARLQIRQLRASPGAARSTLSNCIPPAPPGPSALIT